MSARVALLVVLGLAELVAWLCARFMTWKGHYDRPLYAWAAIHWLVVRRLLLITGALAVGLGRAVWAAGITTALVTPAVEAVDSCYLAVHGRLEVRLIVACEAIRKATRRISRRRHLPVNSPSCHSPSAIWPPGTMPSAGAFPAVNGARYVAVESWHGRVVNVLLGLMAGLIVAGLVWICGLYRLPGAVLGSVVRDHRSAFAITVIVVVGLLLGLLAHQSSEVGGRIDDGFAKRSHLRKHVSAAAVRKAAAITRPGMAAKRLPVHHSGTLLGTHGARKLWATHKDVILALAPPQTGKTAYLGGRIIEAPGAVLATSTKADVFVHTAALRAERSAAWVLNTEGLGGIASNFRWSPLEGCEDPEIATERAGYLLAGTEKGGTDARFWDGMNVKLLRCVLLAAATTGRNMREVWAWINDSTDPTPLRIMESEPTVPREWVAELAQLLHDTPERTRQSVYLTLAQAMQFITAPAVATAICPAPGEPTFSLQRFLNRGETLYLLGSDKPHASIAPLFSAITGHVFEGAKRVAGCSLGGRLDLPLTLALDEAALICPVPLPSMTADSGGRGIQVIVAVQSPSQLYERWGQRGGETIWNNANAKLIFGGLGHAKDLDDLSRICGERDERVRGTSVGNDGHRSTSTHLRRVPVLAPHEIRQLGDGMALLLYRTMPAALVKMERVWERKDVKAIAAAVRRGELAAFQPRMVQGRPRARPVAPVTRTPAGVTEVPNVVAFPGQRPDTTDGERAAGAEE